MRKDMKRVLQLSTAVIVENLHLDDVYPKLTQIRDIGELLERVTNTKKNDTQKASITVLLAGLERFSDEAYYVFVTAASAANNLIATEIIKNRQIVDEEMKQDATRMQKVINAHNPQPPKNPSPPPFGMYN